MISVCLRRFCSFLLFTGVEDHNLIIDCAIGLMFRFLMSGNLLQWLPTSPKNVKALLVTIYDDTRAIGRNQRIDFGNVDAVR